MMFDIRNGKVVFWGNNSNIFHLGHSHFFLKVFNEYFNIFVRLDFFV